MRALKCVVEVGQSGALREYPVYRQGAEVGGRRLSRSNTRGAGLLPLADDAMVGDIPTRSVRTIYSRLGDWFALLTIAGFLVLIVASFLRGTDFPDDADDSVR